MQKSKIFIKNDPPFNGSFRGRVLYITFCLYLRINRHRIGHSTDSKYILNQLYYYYQI